MRELFRQSVFVLFFSSVVASASAATFTENFSGDPATNGWRVFGNANLFQWDSTNRNLRVTWDSSQTNCFFHRSLGTFLTRSEDFQFNFDLRLDDYQIGTTSNKSSTFEIALGFLNMDQAVQTNFFRGAGTASIGPLNLMEFDFFPADSFSATIAQTIVATNHSGWFFNHDNQQDLTPGETFHVAMNYVAGTRTLTTVVTHGAAQYGPTQTITVSTNADFRLTAFSITSYSDYGQNPTYAGSILAHGIVDNFSITLPPPPVQNFTGSLSNGVYRATFLSQSNWLYALQRSPDLLNWTNASPTTPGNGTSLLLLDSSPPISRAFYHVRAERP